MCRNQVPNQGQKTSKKQEIYRNITNFNKDNSLEIAVATSNYNK
jgi:hypothetical protein